MLQAVFFTLMEVIVPLSIPVMVGALLVYLTGFETKHLMNLVLYFLLPCMVFNNLATTHISLGDLKQTVLFCLLNLAILTAVADTAGNMLGLFSSEAAGLRLASVLMNSANYGLPVAMLAFGQAGLDTASVYVVIQMVIINTVGVYFAARSRFSIKNALKSVFSLPTVYAVLLAVVLRVFSLHLPQGLETSISMVAKAYSPIVLSVLGAQMAGVKNSSLEKRTQSGFWAGLVIRSLISPLTASLAIYILGISGTLAAVLLVLASMPVAVNAVVLAEKFNAAPHIVSKCILWTTLGSFLILPLLIQLVRGI